MSQLEIFQTIGAGIAILVAVLILGIIVGSTFHSNDSLK